MIENERLDSLNKRIADLMLKRMKILPQVVQNGKLQNKYLYFSTK